MVNFINILCGCGSQPRQEDGSDHPIKSKSKSNSNSKSKPKPPHVQTSHDPSIIATRTQSTPITSPEQEHPFHQETPSLAPLTIPSTPTPERMLSIMPSPTSPKLPHLIIPPSPVARVPVPESPTVTSFSHVFRGANTTPSSQLPSSSSSSSSSIAPLTLSPPTNFAHVRNLSNGRSASAITQDRHTIDRLISLQATTQQKSISITQEDIQVMVQGTSTSSSRPPPSNTVKSISPWAGVASPRRASAPGTRAQRMSAIIANPTPIIATGPMSLPVARSTLLSGLETVQYVRGGMRACTIKYDNDLLTLSISSVHGGEYKTRVDEITEVFTGKRAFAVAGTAFRLSPWSPYFSNKMSEIAACFTIQSHSSTHGHGRYDMQCATPELMHSFLQALHVVASYERTTRVAHEMKAANPVPAPTPLSSPSNASIALPPSPTLPTASIVNTPTVSLAIVESDSEESVPFVHSDPGFLSS